MFSISSKFLMASYKELASPIIAGDYYLSQNNLISPNSTLQLYLPMTYFNTTPPRDESKLINPSSIKKTVYSSSITLTSDPVRSGRSYSGSFRGNTNGAFIENIQYSLSNWNTLTANFSIEAWVYLPSQNLTISTFNNNTNGIASVGGPSSGGAGLVVRNNGAGVANLIAENGAATPSILQSSVQFPLNQWVNVALTFEKINATTSNTRLYQNGSLVASSSTWIPVRQGAITSQRFHIGSRDYNTGNGYSASFKGYISNFRLYSQLI
jgi:hypothetical protein